MNNLRLKLVVGYLLLSFICSSVYAQTKTDSLRAIFAKAKEDSTMIDSLQKFLKLRVNNLEPEEAIKYGFEALSIADSLNFMKGKALANKSIGNGYYKNGKYVEALNSWVNSLAEFDSIGDRQGVANMNSNIGVIYLDRGADDMANVYFFEALKVAEELKDTLRMATALMNIGAVYFNKKNTWDKALEKYLAALPLSEYLQDNDAIGTVTVNIGEIYLKQDSLKKALFYFEKSLKAFEGSTNVPYTLYDLGQTYIALGEYSTAIEYGKQAYELAKKYESTTDMSFGLIGLAQAYAKNGDTKLSINTFKEAEKLANEAELDYRLEEIYRGQAENYDTLSDFRNAFKYQALLLSVKEKIYNIENDKKLGRLEFKYTLGKKEDAISLLNKDKVIQEQEITRQKLVRNGFVGGFAVVLLFAGVFLKQRNRISKEKKRSDELLLNILPEETAEELKATGTAKAKSFDMVTVMFTDFKNFTLASEKLTPEELVKEINYCYSEFDKIIGKYKIEKIKTIGDAYMCAGGLPVTNQTHPEDIIKAGLEFQQFIIKTKTERMNNDLPYFELRLGIHTGPVVAGIVGIKKFAYDIWGDTVNTASRMESSGQVGKVNISGTTYELVKGKFICTHRGKVEAKNKGTIDMYFVEGVA